MAPVLVNGESAPARSWWRAPSTRSACVPPRPLRRGELRRDPRAAARGRVFGGYRRGAFTGAAEDRGGFLPGCRRRHAVPRRDRRPAAVDATSCCVPSRSVRCGRSARWPSSRSTCGCPARHHKDLGAEVHAGRFRQDLFYRLNVIQIRVPPLRERLEDLEGITERVLERIAGRRRVAVAALPRGARAPSRATPSRATCASSRTLLHRAVALSGGEAGSASTTSGLPGRLGRKPGLGRARRDRRRRR